MNKPSYHDAVERLVNHLEYSGLRKRLELSDQDIADTLWFALQMGVEKTQSREKPLESEPEPISENTINYTSEVLENSVDIYTPPANVLPKTSHQEENPEGLPFQVPAAPALPNKLKISRALRPLMRKVPSLSQSILDIETTVNQIVDALIVKQDIWLPITKPQSERWLTLDLVVEENNSSFIWKETINELNQILENYGIFRTVRSWNLSSNHQGNLQLINRKKGNRKNQFQYSYRELCHSNGRGLILLISDCVSSIWQQPTIYNWLHKWSNKSPTAIMQLLPERLWLSSELGLGYKVKLSAFNPGVPNSQLIYSEDLDIDQTLILPIITLEPESLKAWTKVIAGYGRIQTSAIILDLDFVKEQVGQIQTSPISEISPETIVDRFLTTASPTAQKLAGLMAAVPVSLPVVHLIQKTMLPQSTSVNVAEVFLSGMIEKKNHDREVDEYNFVPGVRKLLNQAMRLGETEKVLDVVSEYIAEKMGLSIKSFTALLLETRNLNPEKQKNLLPFASIAVEVLRNLGGKYAEFAEEFETNNLEKILDNQEFFTKFAGDYICAVKRGGESWTKELEDVEYLFISPQEEVQLYSRFGLEFIQYLTIEGETLSWNFENNETAATITFKENSEDSYFWESSPVGKCFEGWLNYPNEGRIDFRGRFFIPLDNQEFFTKFAGEYICAVRWGGESGSWTKELDVEHLFISSTGEVQLRSRFGLAVIQNLTVLGETLSWNFEDNETAASITFKENSEDSYFWEPFQVNSLEAIDALTQQEEAFSLSFDENETTASITFEENSENSYFSEVYQTGKLFEGWLNYPNEGRIDFRGRLFILLDNQEFFTKFAGEYICAVKWSGESGTWTKELDVEHLFISSTGEVQLRSRFGLAVIQNLTVEGETLSWSFDDNETAASITFTENSEDSYFWKLYQEGKLFEGWLNYPNEGRIDFRGRLFIPDSLPLFQEFIFKSVNIILVDDSINLKTFNFEIAVTKINKSNHISSITIDRYSAKATAFIQDLNKDTQLEMMLIPGGTFKMGSPADELEHRDNESPQHLVTIQPFLFGKYPVTKAQWQFVAQLPPVNRQLDELNSFRLKGKNLPIEKVSWYDAVEFCDRLSAITGKAYRLPSEAEWEYACRAGTNTAFHFGDTITSELANYNGKVAYGADSQGIYRKTTTEVGNFGVANAFGLYDMHGNVREWCADNWHDNYEGAPNDGVAWLNSENDNRSIHILRGGSWSSNPEICRSACRNRSTAVYNSNNIGFRVVCVYDDSLFIKNMTGKKNGKNIN